MPRLTRLDAPGLLQHVMARRIERGALFKDDRDRKSFLERLAIVDAGSGLGTGQND